MFSLLGNCIRQFEAWGKRCYRDAFKQKLHQVRTLSSSTFEGSTLPEDLRNYDCRYGESLSDGRTGKGKSSDKSYCSTERHRRYGVNEHCMSSEFREKSPVRPGRYAEGDRIFGLRAIGERIMLDIVAKYGHGHDASRPCVRPAVESSDSPQRRLSGLVRHGEQAFGA